MMTVLISNLILNGNWLEARTASITSLAIELYNRRGTFKWLTLFLTVPLSQSNHIINLSVLYKNRIRRVLFQSFRFNRILISISHIAGYPDYDTSPSRSAAVESSRVNVSDRLGKCTVEILMGRYYTVRFKRIVCECATKIAIFCIVCGNFAV